MQIVHVQPLVSSLSASDCLVQLLRKEDWEEYVAYWGVLVLCHIN